MGRRVTEILGKPVISADGGERLGSVSDLLLDETSHQLIGVIVSHGVFKKEEILPAAEVQSFGGDAVVSRSSELIAANEWRNAHAQRR